MADLRTYKIPALRESGLKVVDEPHIVLFSKSGYSKPLQALAASDDLVELVDTEAELGRRESQE